MRMRGMSSDPAKQERIDQVLRSIPGGKKKWVRYDEGAVLYEAVIRKDILYYIILESKHEISVRASMGM